MKHIKELEGYIFKELSARPMKEFSKCSRISAAEGMVLLKNDGNLLPLKKEQPVSLFGRTQFNYYKSGTGSGGSVVTEYVSNFVDGFSDNDANINKDLLNTYKDWTDKNPPPHDRSWNDFPWCLDEMPLSDKDLSKAREFSDIAVVFIGRLAGEERDLMPEKGSYYLSDGEREMLENVSDYFDNVCVVLNIGNIIDFSWIFKYNIKSVLIAWQGGMEGGNACGDVIYARTPACGKLTDTIVRDYYDYPFADEYFNSDESIYKEDIFVGYRYFETFKKDSVLFPFGFGLSYTEFEICNTKAVEEKDTITVFATVKNIGKVCGKEILQLYYSAPYGKLSKPSIELCDFAKTKLLAPGESDEVCMSFKISDMASFDDSGISGHRFCNVLENGEYKIFIGKNVRDVKEIYTYNVKETTVTEVLESAVAPIKPFKRLCGKVSDDGSLYADFEDVPLMEYDEKKRLSEDIPKPLEITGDLGIKLYDVSEGKYSLDRFVAQLSEDDLKNLVVGEGMDSLHTTAGTTGACGGLTKSLQKFGIPVLNLCDGPSGIRMLTFACSTSMPCGTQLACTWNKELVEELYKYEGIELRTHKMDALLGPGINIHKNPLNGRNFEYFSEDPYLSGIMASCIVKGISKSGTDAVIKHFFANNKETNRSGLDSVLSERAAREIYLKPFEIAVKNGAKLIMTSYNRVNGIWTAGNFDLTTTVLRNQWGFKGVVVTDWWANIGSAENPEKPDRENLASMVKAQNDIYMVTTDVKMHKSNISESLLNRTLTLGELQRCAKNICGFISDSSAMMRYIEDGYKTLSAIPDDTINYQVAHTLTNIKFDDTIVISSKEQTDVIFKMYYSSPDSDIIQNSVNCYFNDVLKGIHVAGTNGEQKYIIIPVSLKIGENTLLYSAKNKVNIDKVEILKK